MIIEHGQDLAMVIEKVIGNEMIDIINRNPDVFTPSMLKIIKIAHRTQQEWMWENYFRNYEGNEIPREYIRKSFENFSQNRSMMLTEFSFCPDDNNKARLEYLNLCINTDELIIYCFYHIHEFDKLIDNIKMTVRHEMGHMMHYISLVGKPIEDVIQDHENYLKELNDYYEWRKGCDDPKQFLKKYHEISNEAIADELGNVSVEDVIAFDLYNDKDIDLEINVKERSGNFYDY